MRAYVTGSHGFVGRWLVPHLERVGDEVVHAAHEVDVTDLDELVVDVVTARPDVIYHLAAKSHVGASWSDPLETLRVNVLGTEGVIQAALACRTPPRVLMVSSAEVYGAGDGSAFKETDDVRPVSPYAASKAAAEMVAMQAFLGRGLRVIRVRPFNHFGPGQSDSFVISALARRIAAAEREGLTSISVGNLTPRRDFTDVRDVVRCYRLLAAASRDADGEVFNICSGVSASVQEVVNGLLELSKADIVPVEDPALVRPVDVPDLRGDCSKLHALIDWTPEISLGSSLAEMLDWWRARDTD